MLYSLHSSYATLHTMCLLLRFRTALLTVPNTLLPSAKASRNVATSCGVDCRRRYIVEQTEVTSDHLTPEISLRLITPNCSQWHRPESESKFTDPFWAFYWPGGQALTRFILDNPTVVRGKSVLDVGSGCGAASIGAVMSGASHVLANDIDPVAIEAIHLNCILNSVSVATSTADFIGQATERDWDVVFMGDMFYDEEFTERVHLWITRLLAERKSIFIGDPGRLFLENHRLKKTLRKVFEVELPSVTRRENCGFTNGYVWEAIR